MHPVWEAEMAASLCHCSKATTVAPLAPPPGLSCGARPAEGSAAAATTAMYDGTMLENIVVGIFGTVSMESQGHHGESQGLLPSYMQGIGPTSQLQPQCRQPADLTATSGNRRHSPCNSVPPPPCCCSPHAVPAHHAAHVYPSQHVAMGDRAAAHQCRSHCGRYDGLNWGRGSLLARQAV